MKRFNLAIQSLLFVFLISMIIPGQTLWAQEPVDTLAIWVIETQDGNEYFGSLIDSTESMVQLDTETLGLLTIMKQDIKKITRISADRIKEGQFWSDNPQATRYFYAPNGFALKKGEGYYQNVWVFFNHMAFGVNDYMSLGVGMMPAFLAGGAPTPVWVTPKFSFPVGEESNVRFGVGVLAGTVLGASQSGFGMAYVVTTIGSRDANVNLGIGKGYADGSWAQKPTITLSAMVRTGKRGYFITENYLISDGRDQVGIISLGGRRVGKSMSFDLGIVVPVVDGSIDFALPWLGISVPLGEGT